MNRLRMWWHRLIRALAMGEIAKLAEQGCPECGKSDGAGRVLTKYWERGSTKPCPSCTERPVSKQ